MECKALERYFAGDKGIIEAICKIALVSMNLSEAKAGDELAVAAGEKLSVILQQILIRRKNGDFLSPLSDVEKFSFLYKAMSEIWSGLDVFLNNLPAVNRKQVYAILNRPDPAGVPKQPAQCVGYRQTVWNN